MKQVKFQYKSLSDFKPKYSPMPTLGYLVIGDNKSSLTYVEMKKRMCKKLGFNYKGKIKRI